MDICESILERKWHDSERSTSSVLEQNDIEAVEALVCMSSWGQRSQKGDLLKIRPLTPVSDSGDVTTTVHVDAAAPELPKDFHSLSTLGELLLSLETEVKILVVLSWKLALEGKCGKQDLERDEKEVESSEEDGTSSVPGCPERLSGA